MDSDSLTLVFTAIVAISTAVYAILTWSLVSETKRMREAQTEPHLFASLQPEDNSFLIDIAIQNIGFGPAYKINFSVNPEFEDVDLKIKLAEIGFIKSGLHCLAPRQKVQNLLATLMYRGKSKIPPAFKMTIEYQNSVGKPYKDEYLMDFSQFESMAISANESPLATIAKKVLLNP